MEAASMMSHWGLDDGEAGPGRERQLLRLEIHHRHSERDLLAPKLKCDFGGSIDMKKVFPEKEHLFYWTISTWPLSQSIGKASHRKKTNTNASPPKIWPSFCFNDNADSEDDTDLSILVWIELLKTQWEQVLILHQIRTFLPQDLPIPFHPQSGSGWGRSTSHSHICSSLLKDTTFAKKNLH